MTQTMTQTELRENAAQFIRRRALTSAQAWPLFGRDVTLVEEDGPAGSLLFACHTDQSMSLSLIHI